MAPFAMHHIGLLFHLPYSPVQLIWEFQPPSFQQSQLLIIPKDYHSSAVFSLDEPPGRFMTSLSVVPPGYCWTCLLSSHVVSFLSTTKAHPGLLVLPFHKPPDCSIPSYTTDHPDSFDTPHIGRWISCYLTSPQNSSRTPHSLVATYIQSFLHWQYIWTEGFDLPYVAR